jgi:hypothetical protein
MTSPEARKALMLSLYLLAPTHACSQEVEAGREGLLRYVRETYPEAMVLTEQEIDRVSCGLEGSDPERQLVVSVDLNGDKRVDHAVLLKGPQEKYVYEGRTYDVNPVIFVILLGDADSYKAVWESRSQSGAPFGIFIEAASVSKSLPLGQREHLNNPPLDSLEPATDAGIILSSCETSSALYFWSGGEVLEYWLSD